MPEPRGERFAATREWALYRLGEPLTLDVLARQAGVSPRTFSRPFVEETGYTPMQWVMRARIDLARELLERSQRSVEQIAADTRLGTGANLRMHFQRILGTTPTHPWHHAERVPAHLHSGRVARPVHRGQPPCGAARPMRRGSAPYGLVRAVRAVWRGPPRRGGAILVNHGVPATVSGAGRARGWWGTKRARV